jgi:hypothetical protein
MNKQRRIVWTALALVLGLSVWSAVSRTDAGGERVPIAPNEPPPGGVHAVVSAQPFLLERSWRHAWRVEQPLFDAGWLVVLSVDPALVVPRQTEEPVLFAGAQTVERVNFGTRSGRVVAIVPAARSEKGGVALDVSATPFYFGSAMLPERVDAARAEAELADALARGVRPLPVPDVLPLLHLASRDELHEHAALLVLEHAPDEADLGLGMLAPRVPKK